MELRKFIATTIREYLNERQEQYSEGITEGIAAYHRSPYNFNKFTTSRIGSGSRRQDNGWGLYFSNILPSKEYGHWVYKVNLFKDKKDYVLIDTDSPVEENIVNKIVDALDGYNKKSDEIVEFSYYGGLFYNTLSRILGGDKKASLFLLENGIDGLKKNETKNWHDYILFNDNDITIEEIKYDPY